MDVERGNEKNELGIAKNKVYICIFLNFNSDGAVDSYEPQFVYKNGGNGQRTGTAPLPQMLTFKKFLATQDDTLSDEEAIAKYTDYKLEFMRQECERYFQAHKDEEWYFSFYLLVGIFKSQRFRLKYHPEDGKQYREEQRVNLHNRLKIFNEFLEAGRFDRLAVSYEHAEQLIRMMDAGFDLKCCITRTS